MSITENGYSAERQKISLNGTWDFKWDDENRLSYPPQDSGWDKIKVEIISQYATGFGKDGKNHWAWYRRNVRVPQTMKEEQIKIRFSQVKHKAIVYWNGEKVGEHSDGYIPFEIDITGKVNFYGENVLLVGVIDRIALQRADALPYSVQNDTWDGDGSRRPPESALLNGIYRTTRPIGGIVDNVDLVSYPRVCIDDFHITTSVRRSNCMVEVSISNKSLQEGEFEASIMIEDKGKIVKEFPKQMLSLDDGKDKRIRFKQEWANAHYWSHEDPYLYTMVLKLSDGTKVVDEIDFRFGFREYWIEGTDFYLNGKIFKIRRNHFNYGDSYEDAKYYMKTLKSINVNQIRLHHKAAPEWILNYADEIGMTLVPESSFYSRTRWYDIDNPLMWENAKNQWSGIVKSAKNHPSVVMYSVENEMMSTGSYLAETDPEKWERYVKRWAEVGQHIKNLDPTKPLQYSWGKDAGGWAETVNLHYQRDIKYFFQYPNDLYWLENENLTEKEGYGYGGRWTRNYIWKKDKPLILGEFGYQYHANPPHGLTPFIGDDAYVSNNWYKTWYWCLEKKYKAYKYSGITANPWVFTSDREVFFKLEEVFLKNWMSNYYSGEKLHKEIIVLNEDFIAKTLTLNIALEGKNKSYFQKRLSLDLQEGEKWVKELSFVLPKVTKRVNADLNMKLVRDGKTVDMYTLPVHIFPEVSNITYQTDKIGLYDPQGKSFREMTSTGFIFSKINSITKDALSKLQVLIIGKDAVTLQFNQKDIIDEFVRKGGRVIFLEQTLVPNISWPSFRLEIDKDHSSTIAFKAVASHPILNHIEKEDLKYWRGNHQVSRFNFVRPSFWNYSTIAYVGGENGINHTPLVTLPCGKGLYMFSQFVLSDEMSNEPVALILFNNMLKHVLDYKPTYRKAGVFADQQSLLPEILANFGAEVTSFQKFLPEDLDSYDVLFFDGNVNLVKYKSSLERFLSRGGKIVLRELSPEKFKNIESILPADISLKPMPELKIFDPDLVDPDKLKISFSATRDERIDTTPYPLGWENEMEMKEVVCPIRAYKFGSHRLLDGITNTDLFWRKSVGYLGTTGEEIAPITSYMVTGDKLVPLTEPAILAIIPVQKGEIIIDQIDWQTGLKKIPTNTRRIISNFLNNLEIKMTPYNQPREE
jgi:beta-galactosidase